MTSWSDYDFEMERLPLDTDTADRLLAGTVPPEDAPPGYSEVASFLAAARSEVGTESTRDAPGLEVLVAAARSSRVTTPKSPRRSSVHRLKLAAALATATLACTTGLAFAGSLPGAAQDVASSMLAKVGISVPGPNGSAGTHPSIRGGSAPDAADAAKQKPESSTPDQSGQGKGSEISQLATTTDLTGVDKGAAISSLASGGASQAGQHGDAGAAQGSSAADNGSSTADEASGGHSGAGADNGAAGQSHRP